jgi:WD repeat-containing protein 19
MEKDIFFLVCFRIYINIFKCVMVIFFLIHIISLAYDSGDCLVISTHPSEIYKVIQRLSVYKHKLTSMSPSPVVGTVAFSGDTSVKFYSSDHYTEHTQDKIQFAQGFGSPQEVYWSQDAMIVTVTTSEGSVFNFMANFPPLNSHFGSVLAYRSSLREITVVNVSEWKGDEPTQSLTVPVEPEPELLCVGPGHMAVGMNNHAWVYRYYPGGYREGKV